MKNNPRALIVAEAPQPFMLIHDFENIWQVVRVNRAGDAKLIRTIRHGLDRRNNLRVIGDVRKQALTPSADGVTLEISGKGVFQLVLAWSAGFGFEDAAQPSRILTERMGLQTAEQWMTGTLVFLARDHSALLKGDIPGDVIGDFDRYRADKEWHVNNDFWGAVLGG